MATDPQTESAMSDFPEQEMKPLFEAYGAACFEGQHLERTLQLLLLLIQEQDKREGKQTIEGDFRIDSEEANRTLGELFAQAPGKGILHRRRAENAAPGNQGEKFSDPLVLGSAECSS